jgi:REP-associated tyrosine transposase
MPQSLSAVYVHIVFSTKDRRPFLSDEPLRRQLYAGLASISRRLECPSLAIGGVADHVHLLGRQSRSITLADRVRDLKRLSSPWVKEQDPSLSQFAWQAGYGAFSVDPSGLEGVRQYIDGQEVHHRVTSFQDELRRLFRDADVEWDEKYVWD